MLKLIIFSQVEQQVQLIYLNLPVSLKLFVFYYCPAIIILMQSQLSYIINSYLIQNTRQIQFCFSQLLVQLFEGKNKTKNGNLRKCFQADQQSAFQLYFIPNRSYNIMSIELTQCHEFSLKIMAVKMKIKFPCRMALEYKRQTITKQVSSSDNKFVFNEDFILKGTVNQNSFEISVLLFTEKGSKYVSGVIKILAAELIRSEGERIVVPLIKCLDEDAFCQIRVDLVYKSRKSIVNPFQSANKIMENSEHVIQSSQKSKIKRVQSVIANSDLFGSKSQVNFNKIKMKQDLLGIKEQQNKHKQRGPQTMAYKTFSRSPVNKYLPVKINGNNIHSHLHYQTEFHEESHSPRVQKYAESQVYRQGYQKIKEKYKKQAELAKEEAHKRLLLQANQNNMKLEIMRLKLKSQEQEKFINQKNQKLKYISINLNELQRKQVDTNFLREENENVQRKLRMSEETIQTLNRDNDQLKKLIKQRFATEQQVQKKLKNEVQSLKSEIEDIKYEHTLVLKNKQDLILSKSSEIKSRNDTIERQKNLIHQIEKNSQSKLFQFEKTLGIEKSHSLAKLEDMEKRVNNLLKEKEDLSSQTKSLKFEIQKIEANSKCLEYSKKVLVEQSALLSKQIVQLRALKEKYIQYQKQCKYLKEQNENYKRNLQLSLQNKDINLNEISEKYEQKLFRIDKNKKDLQLKIKNLTLKMNDLQAIQEITKSSLQKSKRICDHNQKQIEQIKQQCCTLRDDNLSKEHKINRLLNQHNSYQSKFEKQQSYYKGIFEKSKLDKEQVQKENQKLKYKMERLEENYKENQGNEAKWKLKQRHFEQKLQKQQAKFKQINSRHENTIRDQQIAISESNSSIQKLNKQITLLSKSLRQQDFNAIKNKQILQRSKKDNRILMQKYSAAEITIKTKTQQWIKIQQKIYSSQTKSSQLQSQTTSLKDHLKQEIIQKEKISKILQLTNQDKQKCKRQTMELQGQLKAKEQLQDKYREQIKNHKQQYNKLLLNHQKNQKQYQKFKKTINEVIDIEFSKIFNRVKDRQTPRSSRSKSQLESGNTILLLTQKLSQTKILMSKVLQLNKKLKEQNDTMNEETQNSSYKHQFAQIELHRDIQNLEDEIGNIVLDKEEQAENYDHLLVQLNVRIKQKDEQNEDLNIEIQELRQIIHGLKIDFEENNDLNQKKCSNLNANIYELNEEIRLTTVTNDILQSKVYENEDKIRQYEAETQNQQQILLKNEKCLLENAQLIKNQVEKIQQLKKNQKNFVEQNVQLQIRFNTQKQTKQKYKELLQAEEKKTTSLNQFVNVLIAEKEKVIKQEIQKSELVDDFENKIFDATHKFELLKEQNQKYKKKISQFKDEMKVASHNNVKLEKNLNEQRNKLAKNIEKLREREKEISVKKEYIKEIQQKYSDLKDKNYREITELSTEIETKQSSTISISRQMNETIFKIQNENKKYWEECINLKSHLEETTQNYNIQKEKCEELKLEIAKISEINSQLQQSIEAKQIIINKNNDQSNQLKQDLEEVNMKFFSLETQFINTDRQYKNNLSQTTNEYGFKVEMMSQEYEQKIEIIEKQNYYLKQRVKESQDEVIKLIEQRKDFQIDWEKARRILQDKIKRLENEKLTIITSKNSQNKKISEQAKAYFQKYKDKQGQVRKMVSQAQLMRMQLQQKNNSSSLLQEKLKNKEKLYEKQVKVLKEKQQQNNSFQEKLLKQLHSNEMEVRKIISQVIKRIMDQCDKDHCDKISKVVTGAEGNVVQAMHSQIDRK